MLKLGLLLTTDWKGRQINKFKMNNPEEIKKLNPIQRFLRLLHIYKDQTKFFGGDVPTIDTLDAYI